MTEIQIERASDQKVFPKGPLGFGKYFTPHLFRATGTIDGRWDQLNILPYQKFAVDPAACVLHYGQAIFEGLKAYRGVDDKIRLFRPFENARRMVRGAPKLCMVSPPPELFVDAVAKLVACERDWVPTEPETSLYIRPTLIATEPYLGVRPAQEFLFFVIMSPVGAYYANGFAPVKIMVERTRVRAARGGLGDVKTGANYAASLWSSEQAKKLGYAQVLWLDSEQHEVIEEVGTMNFFVKIRGELLTPSLSGSILPGITRQTVLELAQTWKIPYRERELTLTQLKKAFEEGVVEEAFGSGTAAVISPISEIGIDGVDHRVGDGQAGPLTKKFYQTITDLQYGRVPDQFGWTQIV